jgi:hypothetical protein
MERKIEKIGNNDIAMSSIMEYLMQHSDFKAVRSKKGSSSPSKSSANKSSFNNKEIQIARKNGKLSRIQKLTGDIVMKSL